MPCAMMSRIQQIPAQWAMSLHFIRHLFFTIIIEWYWQAFGWMFYLMSLRKLSNSYRLMRAMTRVFISHSTLKDLVKVP
jgi:hypothetical protein